MARYTDPVCRICRREGLKLFLKGSRCFSKKCAFERRSTPPGMNTQRRRKVSEFGMQMREKQKVRRSYSVLEKQFRNYFAKAEQHKGIAADFIVSAAVLKISRPRRPTDIPSFGTKVGDRIEVREGRRGREIFKTAAETMKSAAIPEWVSIDAAKLAGSVLAEPAREQMPLEFNEQLVVEYYSR